MKRIMLKLSGEALAGDKKTGFDEPTVREVALQVKQLVDGVHRWVSSLAAATFGEVVPVRISTGQRQIRSVCWQRL